VKIKRYLKQPPSLLFQIQFFGYLLLLFQEKNKQKNIDTKWNTIHSFLVVFFISFISQLPYAKKKHGKNQLANAIGGRFLTATHEFATASSSCSAWRLGTFFRMAGGFRKIGETEPILGIA